MVFGLDSSCPFKDLSQHKLSPTSCFLLLAEMIVLDWPESSPDLNHILNLWDTVKSWERRVQLIADSKYQSNLGLHKTSAILLVGCLHASHTDAVIQYKCRVHILYVHILFRRCTFSFFYQSEVLLGSYKTGFTEIKPNMTQKSFLGGYNTLNVNISLFLTWVWLRCGKVKCGPQKLEMKTRQNRIAFGFKDYTVSASLIWMAEVKWLGLVQLIKVHQPLTELDYNGS